jgi:hypothetical protein
MWRQNVLNWTNDFDTWNCYWTSLQCALGIDRDKDVENALFSLTASHPPVLKFIFFINKYCDILPQRAETNVWPSERNYQKTYCFLLDTMQKILLTVITKSNHCSCSLYCWLAMVSSKMELVHFLFSCNEIYLGPYLRRLKKHNYFVISSKIWLTLKVCFVRL